MALFGLFGTKPKSVLTPEAQKRAAALPTSRGGTQPASTYQPGAFTPQAFGRGLPSPSQPLVPVSNVTGASRTSQSSFGGAGSSTGFSSPTALGSQLPKYSGISPTSSAQIAPLSARIPSSPSSATTPGDISLAVTSVDSQPITEEAGAAGAGAGAGASGGGSSGGGYSPQGVGGYLEEEPINTETPSPSTVQAQPFTQPKTNGALSASGESGSLAGGAQPSKYQTGFSQALASMGSSGAMNVTPGQGSALVNQFAPTSTNSTASAFVQSDPFINGLVTAWQDYINPQNQRKSLTDTYNQMIKDSGIEAIDTELIDMKNVIEGSQDDIRTEITKAGGFATESQVLAMTNARNKQIIKNYNTLLDTRNAKEKYLTTAIQLEESDRQSADQRFESMFNMGTQLATMQQQMQQNARSQMQWLASNVGFDGLLDSTGGDPFSIGLIEQSLGLPQGGLSSAANQAKVAKQQAEQERQLGMTLKSEQIKTEQAQRSKIYADIKKLQDSQKGSILDPNTPEGRKQLALNKSKVDQVNNIISSGNLTTAVGPNWFSRYGNIRGILTPGRANFIGDVEQLRSQLSLQALIDAKSQGATFGALSDQELRILSTSGTKIGSWLVDKDDPGKGYSVKESDFKAELDKINNFAKLDYVYRGGTPEDVGVQIINGQYYTKNSNGSVTEL